ncbi:heterokaryon incompatibility protein-domain-containing protein [Xylariaceae sp. FL1651]|nr:heterokaryon incompatibility protein-domain-containing protein [Xylariaceae sp. FL1651]
MSFRDSTLLGVCQGRSVDSKRCLTNGFIGLVGHDQEYDFGIRSVKPDAVDFAFLKQRLDHCRSNHKGWCFPSKANQITGLRVIDCISEDRRVIPAPPGCQYAALSYVWGSLPEAPMKAYSRVVNDAIEATRSLGLQYLWVDKHCIDQHNNTHKQNQISQMDAIYMNSEVTLIDAEGDNSTHGLAGVGRSRIHQRQETVDGVTLLQGFPLIAVRVRESPWATRGWTLQEGYLSPRRVMFTNHGASYLCNTSHCAEWEAQPLLAGDWKSTKVFEGLIPQAGYKTANLRVSPFSAISLMKEYSRRQLSFVSDMTNACLGMLNFLQTSQLYAPWGIIVQKSLSPKGGWDIGLAWYHEHPVKRNPDNPSWSSLGWQSSANFSLPSRGWWRWRVLDSYIHFGDSRAQQFNVSTLMDELKNRRMAISYIEWTREQKLHTTIVTRDPPWQQSWYENPQHSGYYASLRVGDNAHMMLNCCLDAELLTTDAWVIGLILLSYTEQELILKGIVPDRVFEYDARVLLLRSHGAFYERIGYLEVPHYGATPRAFHNNAGERLDEIRMDSINTMFSIEKESIQTIVIG